MAVSSKIAKTTLDYKKGEDSPPRNNVHPVSRHSARNNPKGCAGRSPPKMKKNRISNTDRANPIVHPAKEKTD